MERWIMEQIILLNPDDRDETTLYVNELFPNAKAMFDPIIYPQLTKDADSTNDATRDPYNMQLEEKIYRHYEMRQIGMETPVAFLKHLSSKMNEIMPYYYKLLATEDLITPENALVSYDLTESYEETSENSAQSDLAGESGYTLNSGENMNATEKYSTTPHGAIENVDTYMDSAKKTGTETTGEQTSEKTDTTHNTASGNGARNYTKTTKGNVGARPFAADLADYRKSIQRVDEMIIKELAPLFLGIY